MYVYFYLFTRAALARLDPAHAEAAASLGAGRSRTMRRVTLPMLRPALAGAALLTFMTSLASFSAPYIFGGGFRVMTTQITSSKLNGEDLAAQVETVVLALVALAGLWLFDRMGGLAARSSAVRGVAPSRKRIASAGARVAATVGGWLFAAVLLLPHATLLLISLVPPATWTSQAVPPVLDLSNYLSFARDPGRLEPVLTSLWMATVATLGAIVLGVGAARSASRRRGVTGKALETLIALPWAVPGPVFAIALATTFSVDAPWAGRLVLVGTPWILPLAYLVRNLPITSRAITAGVRALDPSLDEAAASLGAGRGRTLRRVTIPLLRPALLAGASLAFVTAFGDFVTSIMLYTYDTRPISLEILSSLRRADVGVAAAYGVVLMSVSAVVFALGSGQGRGGNAG
jgi:iron(III) transport system permease protein